MTIADALAALERGDEAALKQFTRDDVHLPPSATHFVTTALWQYRDRLLGMANPMAYLCRVATKMHASDEASLFGRQPVYDEKHRRCGHAFVNRHYDRDGIAVEPTHIREKGGALGFIPDEGVDIAAAVGKSERERRADYWASLPAVLCEDDDERALDRAQRLGYSKREMPAHLGWTTQRVHSVYMRLHRRRRAQM